MKLIGQFGSKQLFVQDAKDPRDVNYKIVDGVTRQAVALTAQELQNLRLCAYDHDSAQRFGGARYVPASQWPPHWAARS